MVTLEALKEKLFKLKLEMSEIETLIYGNSKDSFDNIYDADQNTEGVSNSRHTLAGLLDRRENLMSQCQYSQGSLDANKKLMILFCQ